MAKQKLTKQQREARAKAAEEREARQKAAQERATRTKRIFTIVVCAILVLALSLPTMGLALCSNQQVEQAGVEQVDETADAAATDATAETAETAAADATADAAATDATTEADNAAA